MHAVIEGVHNSQIKSMVLGARYHNDLPTVRGDEATSFPLVSQ